MKSPDRTAIERLVITLAGDIEPLLDEFVFVGGVTTALLVTDPAMSTFPVTDDVDVVVEVTSRTAYEKLSERLRELGLRHDTSPEAPLCRWITPSAGLRLDVMPNEAEVLGFSNPWYDDVLETSGYHELEPGLTVRIAAPACHLAAKWAAYHGRGSDDPLASRDLEDIVLLVAGRPEIVEEVAEARPKLRQWVATETVTFLRSELSAYVLQGNLPDARSIPDLVGTVRDRLERIAALAR